MGRGIAQVYAQSGIRVLLNDISQELIEKGLKNISWSFGKIIEKRKLSESKEAILDRIEAAVDFSRAGETDLALEAVFENLNLKKEIFKKLDESCKPQAFIASNTSTIPITELAMLSISRQCELLGLSRASYYYCSEKDESFNLRLINLIDKQFTRTSF